MASKPTCASNSFFNEKNPKISLNLFIHIFFILYMKTLLEKIYYFYFTLDKRVKTSFNCISCVGAPSGPVLYSGCKLYCNNKYYAVGCGSILPRSYDVKQWWESKSVAVGRSKSLEFRNQYLSTGYLLHPHSDCWCDLWTFLDYRHTCLLKKG